MIKHLQTNKRLLVLIITLFMGLIGTTTMAQTSEHPHAFSVSATQQVYFSPGNLQYKASTNTWRFAINPWDYVGDANSNISSTYDGWIDLFGWGTSGYNHGATCYQPWSTSTTNSQYYAYGSSSYNLFDQTGQADWGYNPISNGGNQENGGWRTLTYAEWNYVFNTRTTASGLRYAKAAVNGVNGMILLPDDWNSSYYTLNTSYSSYSANTISVAQWASLERYGAVFLPAAGYRYGTSLSNLGSTGNYWSASYYNGSYAYHVYFADGGLNANYKHDRYYGLSVRLVRPAENYSININVVPSPTEGGAVSGAGAYMAGAVCTLTAMPSAGYASCYWTEEGVVVSWDATYSFIALRDRNLVANFVKSYSFSVSTGQQVYFSPGNLQYRASTNTWRFAIHPWNYIGSANSNISSTCDGWIDLFGWGTSGYNHGANCYQPWSTNTNNSDYYAYGSSSYNLFDQTSQADWGYNAISNGSNTENTGWRTLTRYEWNYLFYTRVTSSGIRYAKAIVNNVNGVILLPDDWQTSYYSLTTTNTSDAGFSTNVITISQWATLEQHGAIFLPAAGYRIGTSMYKEGIQGDYWSATVGNSTEVSSGVQFDDSTLVVNNNFYRKCGFSVRLVRAAETYSFSINATPSPAEGGAVSGVGAYPIGAECTLTATASEGWVFFNWTEEGTVVPGDATYTFIALRDRNLVANFVSDGNIVFADATVKQLCVANWDTNGDGELSYLEAANVTSLGAVFKNKTSIHSFNELQHFISLSLIGEQAFYGCTKLTQVTIPEQVASIGNMAFWNCPALQTVFYNAVSCGTMQSTYDSNTYSVFSSNSSGGASALTRVVIGSNVMRIPDYAFKGSSDIYQRLVIPASVTRIGNYAFDGCSSIPLMLIQGNGLLTIGQYAFRNCSAIANALNLPNSVTTVSKYAFYGCTLLPSLTIGEGVAIIGACAFWKCPGLTMVSFNATNCNQMYTRMGNSSSDYQYFSVFNSGTSNGGATPIVTLTIGDNVTRIPDYAFMNSSNLTSEITIPETTTYIGLYAFYGAQSPSLTIGEGVTTIGEYAFWDCSAMTTVNFNAINCELMNTRTGSGTTSNPYVYYSVFNSGTSNGGATPIVTLTIGDNVTRIPNYAFRNSSNAVGTLLLPETLTHVGQYAFYGCSSFIGDLTIPNAVTEIGPYAFYNCSGFNGTLTLSNALSTIKNYTFYGCSGLTGTLTIPETVTAIGSASFYGCSGFTGSLVIHDGLVSLDSHAFYGCSSIPELTIGEGVTTIGGYAFWNCPQLQTVHFNATNCTSMVSSFYQYNTYHYSTVFNSASGDDIFNATSFLNACESPIVTLTIGENVTNIPDYAFSYCSNMNCNLIIPDAVTSIGAYAFANCSGQNVIIGEGVSSIGQHAFSGSSGFNGTLRFGNALVSIGEYAFSGCSGFTGDLVFPNSVTSLGSRAFYNCSGFDGSLVLGSGISAINSSTFYGCSGFTESLIIGRAVNSIGDYAFKNCSGFTSLIAENPAPITATSNSFTGMTYTIPVHVPYGLINNYQNATGWSSFSNYKNQFTFEQLDNANWSDAMNWYTFELPGPNDVVCVNSDCNLDMDADVLRVYVLNLNDVFTVNSGQTLEVNYGVGILQASQLVLEEGSQLINNLPGVQGTIQMNLGGKGRDGDGWYTIAAPIYGGMPVNTITTGDYDLFAYDEPTHYWRNQKVADNGITRLNLGQGYLYANQSATSLSLSGELNPSNATVSVPVTYEGTPLEGYTLVGNPYTNNLNIGDVQLNGTPLTTYYKVHGGGSLVAYTDADPIHPGEGFLVMAPEGGTLTFGPSRGRSHDSDETELRDEGEPMGGFRLPAHGDLIDVDAYNGEVQYVNVTVAANDTEGGMVTGSGNYAVGSTCTLTAVPNELYAFVDWTCNGVSVSTNPTYSFTVMGEGVYTANFVLSVFTQTATLTSGWNWWSTYIDQSDIDGLTMLEDALGNNGLRIVSHKDGYVEPLVVEGDTYWYGTLSGINNEQMYKVMTNASCNVPISGGMASPSDHPITIHSGWNWIGYPSNQMATVNEALAGFEAEDDDIIKSHNNGYATYYDGSWYGSLTSLSPGSGYMYKSNGSESKTMVFQQGRGQGAVEAVDELFACSGSASNNYQDNMTVTAVVELDGEELHSTDYELAAFVGEECRGSVRLMHVAPINRYVAFLTVFGEGAEPLRFWLTDGERLIQSDVFVTFQADAVLGSLDNPMKLSFSTLSVGESDQRKTMLFPNPVKEVLCIEGTGMKRVEVFNAMGQRVVSADAEGGAARIDMSGCASGVYLVLVMTENGMVTRQIVKE